MLKCKRNAAPAATGEGKPAVDKPLFEQDPSLVAWWRLARATQSMIQVMTRFIEEHGLTGAQFGVVRCVGEAGPEGLMLTQLSERLMVTCGNITGVMDRLEQAGYIRRERSVEDRRVVMARLTPEGQRVYEQIIPAYRDEVIRLFSGLSLEEQEQLGSLAQRLQDELDAIRQPVGAR